MTKQELAEKEKQGYRYRFGVLWPPQMVGPKGRQQAIPRQEWWCHAQMFLDKDGEFAKSPTYQGKAYHFREFAKLIWGDPNDEGFFEWNPNVDRMLELATEHNFLAIAGCASSGKSMFLALWAVAMFMLDPLNTKVLVTSMTIQTAEGKVWGNIKKFWRRACRRLEVKDGTGKVVIEGEKFIGGKLLDSMHIIKRRSPDGTLHSTEGIELIPAEAGEFKKSASKMQGYKAGNVYLLADELATLAPNILETARENLFANDNFRLVGAFNPDSHYDPGGILAEPVDGWDSINEDSTEWATKFGGWCVRFDGLQSPNVLAGEKIWRGLLTIEKLNGFRELHPEKSAGFWKMVRGYWSPTGSLDCIYAESEFEANGCTRPVKAWVGGWVMVAGFDPAWVSGGDRAIATFGRVGLALLPEHGGITRTVWEHVETAILGEDITNKGMDKSQQIAKQFAQLCRKHKVATENVALDITGGHAFATVLGLEIGRGFMAINFGGAASDLPMPKPDKRTCREAFRNMVSELWYSSKPLVRQGQLRNVQPATIVELCARTYDETNGRIMVEPKEKMKLRTKRSPDRADSMMLSVFVARKKHGLAGTEKFPKKHTVPNVPSPNPLDHLLDWAKPQRKTCLEEFPVGETGSGWGAAGFS